MKYPEKEYLEHEFYGNEDYEIKCQSKKIVKTRKEHYCCFSGIIDRHHDIPADTLALRESAIVEGKWGSSYSCIECLDIWLDYIYEGKDF